MELPFGFLHRADPRQVLSFIENEHPQTITLVLAHMPPDRAAMVLSGLPEDRQRSVAHRLAVMDRTTPAVIAHAEHVLDRKLSSVLQPAEITVGGGVQTLVAIHNRPDLGTQRPLPEPTTHNYPEPPHA